MISGRHYISLNQDAKLVTKSENNTTQTQKSSSSGVVRKLVTSLWTYDSNPMTLLIICPFAIGNFPMAPFVNDFPLISMTIFHGY